MWKIRDEKGYPALAKLRFEEIGREDDVLVLQVLPHRKFNDNRTVCIGTRYERDEKGGIIIREISARFFGDRATKQAAYTTFNVRQSVKYAENELCGMVYKLALSAVEECEQ